MRKAGTKYDKIEKLPIEAKPVSMYADEIGTQVPQIYIKYERYLDNKGKNPGYVIRQYQNMNYIIPIK